MSQFDRIASLLVGTAGSQEAVLIEGLRIGFSVTKTKDATTNKAQVVVYNLNEDTRNKIGGNVLKTRATLQAGYAEGDGLQNIFTGDITTATTRYDFPDIVTTLDCKDGFKEVQDRLSVSFNAGSKVRDVLNDVMNKLGISRKSSSVVIPNHEFVNGFAFGGPVKDLLDKMLGAVGYTWSFQDGELKFYPKDGKDETLPFDLTAETGLIKAPEKVKDVSGDSGDKEAIPGWNVTSLLLPSLEPGNPIRVSSNALPTPTDFVIERVEHRGDTFGGEYLTSLLVKEI